MVGLEIKWQEIPFGVDKEKWRAAKDLLGH